MLQTEIITIGDELLIGQVVDTNSAFMAQRLNEVGIALYQITSVHDDATHIRQAVDAALQRVDVVITTGGLGPTKDDITKRVLCDYFGTTLVYSAEVEKHVRELYCERPQVLNRLTATQWMVPESATILSNRVGSAPLMVFERDGKYLISLPGVPREMEIAMTEQIIPFLQTHCQGMELITHRTICVEGIPESALAIELEQWENDLPANVHLAYLPKDGKIRLRLSGYGVSPTLIDTLIESLQQQYDAIRRKKNCQ